MRTALGLCLLAFALAQASNPTRILAGDPSAAAPTVGATISVAGATMATSPACEAAIVSARRASPVVLDEVLRACPELTSQIVWTTGAGVRQPENAWPLPERSRFEQLFKLIDTNASDLGLKCSQSNTALNGSSWVYVPTAEAFDIYAAHVAHALDLEIRGTVPWTLRTMPTEESAEILSSDRYFARILPAPGQRFPPAIQANRDFQLPARARPGGDALVCDPRVGERFLRGETSSGHVNLLGTTDRETMVHLVWWFQQNVHHDFPGDGPSGMMYTKPADLTMFLTSRLHATATPAAGNVIIASFGCHSAANLFHDLAVSVNIPVLVGNMQTEVPKSGSAPGSEHAGLAFHWTRPDALVLEHADDMYQADSAAPSIVGTVTPLLPAGVDSAHNFFAAVWRAPEFWNDHGFHYGRKEGALYLPTADMNGIYRVLVATTTGPPVGGWQLGYWTSGGPGGPESADRYFQSMAADEFATCSWPALVKTYCSVPNMTEAQFQAKEAGFSKMFPAGTPNPWGLSPAAFYQRASACAGSVGGCARAAEAEQQWLAAFGSNVLK
jgi:hypothetical protein